MRSRTVSLELGAATPTVPLGLLERSREVTFRHSTYARLPPDGPFLVRGGVHSVLRVQPLGLLATASTKAPAGTRAAIAVISQC